MKECKCGKMPPCYGNLECAIYEEAKEVNDEWKKSRARHYKMIDKLRSKLMEGGFLDDTHDKVYGLNKQMCDIGNLMDSQCFWDVVYAQIKASREASERRFAKYIKQNEDIMEEKKTKKTKKMTKVEAYVYLNDTKVYVNGKGDKVLEVLSKVGFEPTFPQSDVDAFPFMGISDKQVTYYAHMKQYLGLPKKEISVDDILSIEIVEEENEPLDKWDDFARRVAKIQETLEDDEVCIITKGNFLTMTK